jgi:hypothetical protein
VTVDVPPWVEVWEFSPLREPDQPNDDDWNLTPEQLSALSDEERLAYVAQLARNIRMIYEEAGGATLLRGNR